MVGMTTVSPVPMVSKAFDILMDATERRTFPNMPYAHGHTGLAVSRIPGSFRSYDPKTRHPGEIFHDEFGIEALRAVGGVAVNDMVEQTIAEKTRASFSMDLRDKSLDDAHFHGATANWFPPDCIGPEIYEAALRHVIDAFSAFINLVIHFSKNVLDLRTLARIYLAKHVPLKTLSMMNQLSIRESFALTGHLLILVVQELWNLLNLISENSTSKEFSLGN